jgi:C-terminal processing protease CtpA/Prc
MKPTNILKVMQIRILLYCLLLAAATGRAATTNTPLNFDEVYQLLRTNLEGVSKTDLDRDAVKGLLEQLPGQATIVRPEAEKAAAAGALTKVNLFDGSYGYFRIGQVEGDVAGKLRAEYNELAETNKSKIKGIILDLRFAGGNDYRAAAAVADCFLDSDRPLLDWGTGAAGATKKTNALTVPVAVLVNSQTRGAAEAVAAALRETDTGLILGGTTAGQASMYKEFPLANGDKLRIATAPIKLGDGAPLAHGVKPDIEVAASVADEKEYLTDPYKDLHPPAPAKKPDTNSTAAAGGTFHRPNEAELVRERREGQMSADDSEEAPERAAEETPPPPVIEDAALARALDLLKGLAVIQLSHPG